MAFTGDLEHLHIVDVIQLIHTTRKTGTLTVRGDKGESRIIFSNGYIVGANHLNNRVRIGAVLVKINAIAQQDLDQALELQKKAGKARKPLITTLIEMEKLGHEDAFRGLKELIVMTLVDLIGWLKGTFTLDSDAISVSPECSYFPDKMDQEISLDGQMVLMDALRIYDERERDRNEGKDLPPYEDLFEAPEPPKPSAAKAEAGAVITAEDLGLADLDRLEKKTPNPFSVKESFDAASVHRQNISETLGDFSPEEQGIFVSFLEKSTGATTAQKGHSRLETVARALILFSVDKLIKHSVMTICKNEGILVFAPETEKELDSIVAQCLQKKISPVLVLDSPESSDSGLSEERINRLIQDIKSKYPDIPRIQMTSPLDYTFTLQSFNNGARAVFPKPLREFRKETFVEDTIKFLQTLRFYIKELLSEPAELSNEERILKRLRDRFIYLRDLEEPADVSFALLQSVSEIFERSITFFVRQNELIGGRAIGVSTEKNMGPTTAAHLKIPLTEASVFSDVVENGQMVFGESHDRIIKKYLFEKIGAPLHPNFILLPMKSRSKTMTLTYGDFGKKEPAPVNLELFDILANYAGVTLENVLYRKHYKKASQK